ITVLLCCAVKLQNHSKDGITLFVPEESSLEGSTATLSYRYSRQATGGDQFYWYRQYPGKPPEFLTFNLGTQNTTNSKLSVRMVDDRNGLNLQISSAAVSDSAVYYCAVRPTVTGNSKTLYKNLWSKDNRILHNIH
uniref:Ig-like domain-containing protein n=1 Tax=Maylandia zebra TaxID=106582 RepID=A0A3P9B5L8_9CICH